LIYYVEDKIEEGWVNLVGLKSIDLFDEGGCYEDNLWEWDLSTIVALHWLDDYKFNSLGLVYM